ncbi:MAG: Asp-tRNA(Asn)/Glu-tRNA(Gln) amidotransferase A subunit family amidase [Gammaproteobacteria bacterium]|jgi:Asp-tRNA(Asn)/Glu-tRNA(Gln) amidotransferase A subunit family amidase
MSSLNELCLTELTALRSAGKLDEKQLLEDCIQRISQREPEVQAFQFFNADQARKSLSSNSTTINCPATNLSGIPFGVKDIMDTWDMPTTWGSPIYKDHRPAKDAGIVAALRSHGAQVMGKTVTTEFAYFFPGKTKNPKNTNHTPGGSSQGSAAAVADFMIPFSLGSQTAASVIRPAAYCGVVGYKASHGEFDLGGICSLSQSMDSLGIFVRDARDLQLIRTTLLGCQTGHNSHHPQKIGVVKTPHWLSASEETRNLLINVSERVRDAGVEVIDLQIGPADESLTEAQKTIMAYEVARSRAFEYHQYRSQISPQFKALVEDGMQLSRQAYEDASTLADTCRQQLAEVLLSVDFLLTPSATGEAPEGIDSTGDPLFSRMWNLLGGPAVTLPAGTGPKGLPLGVQLIGGKSQDDKLLENAVWLQNLIS